MKFLVVKFTLYLSYRNEGIGLKIYKMKLVQIKI